MAEIIVLPARPDQAGLARMKACLSRAFEEGVEIGPRGPHIDALSRVLEQKLERLRQEVAWVQTQVDPTGPKMRAMGVAIDGFVRTVESVMSEARFYRN